MDSGKTCQLCYGTWNKVSEFIKKMKFVILSTANVTMHWGDVSLALKYPLE